MNKNFTYIYEPKSTLQNLPYKQNLSRACLPHACRAWFSTQSSCTDHTWPFSCQRPGGVWTYVCQSFFLTDPFDRAYTSPFESQYCLLCKRLPDFLYKKKFKVRKRAKKNINIFKLNLSTAVMDFCTSTERTSFLQKSRVVVGKQKGGWRKKFNWLRKCDLPIGFWNDLFVIPCWVCCGKWKCL